MDMGTFSLYNDLQLMSVLGGSLRSKLLRRQRQLHSSLNTFDLHTHSTHPK